MSASTPLTSAPESDDQTLWRALADPTRRAILDLLRTGPATTGTVAAAFPISRIAVMKHLETLSSAGLVTSRKRGRERWNYVNLAPLLTVRRRWATPTGEAITEGVLRLKDKIEAPEQEPPMSAEITTIDVAVDVDIEATPATVFAAIGGSPGAWWGPPFMRPDAVALECTPDLGSYLIERWPSGAMAMATVTGVEADAWLQWTGPFHLGPATAVADFTITPTDQGSHVALTFRGSGLIEEWMIEAFGGGWNTLITEHLKAFAESGTRLGVEAS